jgi:hypothetical protein
MADDAQIQLPPQPDILLMSQTCHTFGNEVAKISNIPQFDAGNAILDQLRQISTRLDRIDTRLDTLETRLDTRLDTLETRLDTMNTTIRTR